VANLLPAGIFLPLRPFLNALQIFLELLNNFLNKNLTQTMFGLGFLDEYLSQADKGLGF
jgi:hypothetical protein